MSAHNEFGKLAEDFASEYLAQRSYQILKRNFRYRKAEVDIIAQWKETIVFVEVKARQSGALLEPHEAVNRKKIKLLVEAADAYMKEENRSEEVRFDIISILADPQGKMVINHMKDAFQSIDF